jgi:hypothetical protein
MRRLILFSCVALLLSSHGLAGETARESRQISGVNQVVLRRVGDLILTQSDRESLVIEAEARLLPKISTEVRSGVLYLDFNEKQIFSRSAIRFHLNVKNLYRMQSEGSGNIASGKLRVEYLEIEMQGSGQARIESLSAKQLKVRLAGAGDVRIDGGDVAMQEVSIEGSGDYAAPQLASTKTAASISGSGSIAIAAQNALAAKIAGSGEIRYLGNPTLSQSITGAGRIKRVGS